MASPEQIAARNQKQQHIVIDEVPRPYKPLEPTRGRPSPQHRSSSLAWFMVILTSFVALFAASSFTPSWNAAVDSINHLRGTKLGAQWWPIDPHSSAREIGFRIHASPVAALTLNLKDKIDSVNQAVEKLEECISNPDWHNLAGNDVSYVSNVPHQGDLVKQIQNITGILRSISGRRVDSLDQNHQRYCLDSFATVIKARTRIGRIRYIFFGDTKQQNSKEEVCRLSREQYNLSLILLPKNARVYDPMAKLLVATHKLAYGIDMFLHSKSHCPPMPKVRRDSIGQCVPDLPGWLRVVPTALSQLLFKNKIDDENALCNRVRQMEELQQLTGQTCLDQDKISIRDLIELSPDYSLDMVESLNLTSKKLLEAVEGAWEALKQYTDRFKFLRLFDYHTHQRWQCSGWEELQQREMAADMEHDQRMDEQSHREFWGGHLLNRSNVVLEGHLRNPEAVVQVYHLLLIAMFGAQC